MKKTILITSAILSLFILSCKKDNLEKPSNKNDSRDKYVGNYNVSEDVRIMFNNTYHETDAFTGQIEKIENTDSTYFTNADASFLSFTYPDQGKPWTKNGFQLVFGLIGTDSLEFDLQAELVDPPMIYGNNDSIVINFLYGTSSFVYNVKQKWVIIK
ncbi:MAG TPA: hypothetical protein VLZ75_12810 [Chitinophagales bacterium]|nr:hypothetical protein [Chitinophagales bacterium]